MSNVPDGAQVSDDGQWWWDEGSGAWQPVGSSGGDDYTSGDTGGSGGDVDEYGGLSENYTEDAGGYGEGGDGGQGAAGFDFDVNGVVVSKQDGYGEEYDDDVLIANFGVANVGKADGVAYVELTCDGDLVGTWESESIPAGGGTSGSINGLGPLPAGEHEFYVTVTPAGPNGGKAGPTRLKVDAR